MRKWAVPLTVLGLGGVGALLFSDRGRRGLQSLLNLVAEVPERFAEWNETAQRQMEEIQRNLDEIAVVIAEMRPAG